MTLASLLAGFVDAIVGGGGLVMVPALFAAFPGAPPATLLVHWGFPAPRCWAPDGYRWAFCAPIRWQPAGMARAMRL